MEADTRDETIGRLIEAVQRNTDAMERLSVISGDWRRVFFRGVLAGLGGVIGATLVITLVFAILEPLKGFEGLGPAIEGLSRQLERQPDR